MKPGRQRFTKVVITLVVVVAAAASLWAWQQSHEAEVVHEEQVHNEPRAHLVAGQPNTIELPSDVYSRLGVTVERVTQAERPSPLKLEGSLFLNADRMTHVHTRFPGEVMEIGKVETFAPEDNPNRQDRTLRFGDQVHQNQLLAVIWSKELGEKKSEMVDALSRLYLDQETLVRLDPLYKQGSLPERTLRESERLVEADRIAVDRAERTLRTWRLTEKDLNDIRLEARRIHENKGVVDDDRTQSWARVEVRAAIEGVIVEKNINVGDIVDLALDLFKIANLTRLDVLAHAYEEDLKLLEDMTPDQRRWNITLMSSPTDRPLEGSFDQIGRIIDPNQHTALIRGWVDNMTGRLRVGQFVSARVMLPANPDEVSVSASTLVDQDGETYVFVKTNPDRLQFTLKHIRPTRRHDQFVFVTSKLSDELRAQGYEDLNVGEVVVSSGCLEMARELRDLGAGTQLVQKDASLPQGPSR